LIDQKYKFFLKIVSDNFAPEKLAAHFTTSLLRDLTAFLEESQLEKS
jgi:hypothetical protein